MKESQRSNEPSHVLSSLFPEYSLNVHLKASYHANLRNVMLTTVILWIYLNVFTFILVLMLALA